MSKRDVKLLLEDILESIDKIFLYTKGLDSDSFPSESIVIDAVVRNFEIIGEASKQIPVEWRESHPSIEWHKLAGIRNRIIHEYFGVDLQIIWAIISKNLEGLRSKVEVLLESTD